MFRSSPCRVDNQLYFVSCLLLGLAARVPAVALTRIPKAAELHKESELYMNKVKERREADALARR